MPSTDHPGTYHFRRLVYSMAISVGVSFGAILYGTSVLITSNAAGAEFSLSLLSTAFSGSILSGAAIAVHVGRSVDKYGARWLVGLGGVLVMLGFLGFSFSTAPWQVFASWWLLIGPGSSMVLFEPAFVSIQQWFGRELRNRAAGLLTVITGLAGPIFVPATTYAVEHVGWRPTAAALGVIVCMVSGITALWSLRVASSPQPLVRPEGSAPADDSASHESPILGSDPRGNGTAESRSLPAGFILLTVTMGLTMAVLESFNVHRIARFEAVGFSPEVLAWWAAAVGILSLPARFLLPILANRIDSAKLWVALTVLIMPSVWLTIRGTQAWEMNGHFIVFGLLFGAFMPLRAIIMSDWYSGARFGSLMGLQAVAIALGRAGGPAIVGWLADSALGYPGAMLALTMLLILSLFSMILAMARHRNVLCLRDRGL